MVSESVVQPAPAPRTRPPRRRENYQPTGKPPWLKVRAALGPNYRRIESLMRDLSLNTVCEEAHCPNIFECWERGTATFMILGDICTRACGFCAVKSGRPTELDWAEPERVAEAVSAMGLKHAVITSVTRDDLTNGGAEIFRATIRAIRERCPGTAVEVLIPDYEGNWEALAITIEARPDVLNHNLETVPRLYPWVRPKARYERSLELLQRAKAMDGDVLTKTGIMVGLGETLDEIRKVMEDVHRIGVDIMTIGQYLRPSIKHLPVERYYRPEEFDELKRMGEAIGIPHVEAGPLVRSSYHAHEQLEKLSGVNV
ncbi:MAG: lipoyl synthase [Firmicutes bacterium]|nr:lipoyl synthase [Bacillota bacterium]